MSLNFENHQKKGILYQYPTVRAVTLARGSGNIINPKFSIICSRTNYEQIHLGSQHQVGSNACSTIFIQSSVTEDYACTYYRKNKILYKKSSLGRVIQVSDSFRSGNTFAAFCGFRFS